MTNFLMGKGYWEYIEGEHEEAPVILDENPTGCTSEGVQGLEPGSQESVALVVYQY